MQGRTATLALAALAACLAAPAPALALPAGAAVLSGGSIGTRFDPPHISNRFTQVRLAADGSSLTFYGDWQVRCGGDRRDAVAIKATDVAIAPDGGFVATGTLKGSSIYGSQEGNFSISGRFVNDHLALGGGRASVRVRRSDGKRYDCASGDVRFTLIDSAHPSARVRPGITAFFGTSKQGFPTMLRIARDGRSLRQGALEYTVSCRALKGGAPVAFEAMPGPIRIGRDGSFARTQRFETRFFVPGRLARFRTELRGRFAGGKLAGAWRIEVRLLDPKTRRPKDFCSSGVVPFTAANS